MKVIFEMRKILNPINKSGVYVLLVIIGICMIYPLLWLIVSSVRPNQEIFVNIGLIPSRVIVDSYINGWQGSGQYTYARFFSNTFKLVFPMVLFTVISSLFVAYGFARFRFPFKKTLFALMISSLFLPKSVLVIPRYMLFKSFGWIDTYLPFIIPAIFAANAFFIFMMIQFIRGIPREIDEAAIIDGCNSFDILIRIIAPLSKPALFSAGIFEFIWAWNDFFNPLIFINSVKKFPISLALRMTMDITESVQWNQIMAMSVLTMVPPILIFFFAQKYFVEGISTTGLKG